MTQTKNVRSALAMATCSFSARVLAFFALPNLMMSAAIAHPSIPAYAADPTRDVRLNEAASSAFV